MNTIDTQFSNGKTIKYGRIYNLASLKMCINKVTFGQQINENGQISEEYKYTINNGLIHAYRDA